MTPSVKACLSHPCHGVRLAAVSCLVQLSAVDGSVAVATIDGLVRTLAHTHAHVTSPAVLAATAATAAVSASTAKPLSRSEKLKQSLRLGKGKEGSAAPCVVSSARFLVASGFFSSSLSMSCWTELLVR